jgi:hypothetical protein
MGGELDALWVRKRKKRRGGGKEEERMKTRMGVCFSYISHFPPSPSPDVPLGN